MVRGCGAKDVDKTVSFYAEGAMVMPPNASGGNDKEAIRSAWQGYADESWRCHQLEGDQGGSGEVRRSRLRRAAPTKLTMTDASGKPVNDRGKYRRGLGKDRPTDSGRCGSRYLEFRSSGVRASAPERKVGCRAGRA